MWLYNLEADRNQDLWHYNLPTANDEVTAIIPGDGSEEQSNHRDILLRLHGGQLRCISHMQSILCFSALCCPLSSMVEDGWHNDIPAHHSAAGRRRAPNFSEMVLPCLLLAPKPGEQPPLFWGGNLLQQYVVDWLGAIYRAKQIKLDQEPSKGAQADVYSGLRDVAIGDRDENINLADHGTLLHPTSGTPRNSTGSEISDPLGSSDQYIFVSSFHIISFDLLIYVVVLIITYLCTIVSS